MKLKEKLAEEYAATHSDSTSDYPRVRAAYLAGLEKALEMAAEYIGDGYTVTDPDRLRALGDEQE